MKKVLIAYATKTGSTGEVAAEVGKVLSGKGFTVEVKVLDQVQSLGGYDAIVVGAPVNGMHWRPDALEFIKRNREIMQKLSVAYFLLSVALTGQGTFFKKRVLGLFGPAIAEVEPIKTGFFPGVMAADPPFILRLVFGLKKGAPKDGRDWDAIRKWAEELAGLL